jgi:hypothetical protein
MLRFHTPAHRIGHTDFPHPALRLASLTRTQHAPLDLGRDSEGGESSPMNQVLSENSESIHGVDRQSHFPGSWSLPVTHQKSGSFSPPELPGFFGTTSLSATPQAAQPVSRGSPVESHGLSPLGFPVFRRFPQIDMPTPLPRRDRSGAIVASFPTDGGLP